MIQVLTLKTGADLVNEFILTPSIGA